MGAPSQAVAHALLDRVAAYVQADMAAEQAKALSFANLSFWEQVDATGDPAVEAGLGVQALALDAMGLPEYESTALATTLLRQPYRDFMAAFGALVVSASGGGYSTFHDYLEDKAVLLHPLAAELANTVLGAGIFSASGDVTQVFAPASGCVGADRVYVGADGALAEDTVDFNDAGLADVTVFTADNHCLYVGSRRKFTQLILALSTLSSADIVATVEYWNGNDWVDVPGLTDASSGLTVDGLFRWTEPSDWTRHNKDAGSTLFADKAPLYYIRVQRTANTVVTPPVISRGWLCPVALSSTGIGHLPVQQPPLAICRITGTNLIEVFPVAGLDYARWLEAVPQLKALTPFAVNLTPTLAYVDQDGNDASDAQPAWVTPVAGDVVAMTLDAGDTGVRSIRSTGNSVTTAATYGVFEIGVAELRTPAY